MQIKKVFYLGLVGLFTFSSITSVPSRALAVETSDSSASSQSSAEVNSDSSPAIAESSGNDTRASDASSDEVQTRADTTEMTQAIDTNPLAPTATDGVQSPSWSGLHIILPIIPGIIVQPQSEQYLVADSRSKMAVADLSLKVSTWLLLVLGSNVVVTPTRWTLQADHKTWVKTTDAAVSNHYWTNTDPKIELPTNLAVGTYYFQYDVTVHGLLGLGTKHKTSKLVKTVVVPSPIDATAITMTTPKVVFENATYTGTAMTTPNDATGLIEWNSSLADKITWDQKKGRNASYVMTQPTDINTSTTNPGIKKQISAQIINTETATSGNLVDYKDIYVGGLVAKEMAANDGGTWSLDAQGLSDLGDVTTPEDGSNVSWKYQWQYSNNNGNTFTNLNTKNSEGVSNFQGSIHQVTDLTAADNMLTFTKKSGFIKQAAAATNAGNSYVMRVVLTASIPTGNGDVEDITINSNKGRLSVTAPVGHLSLDQVPTFNFGDVTASDIYNGTIGIKQTKPEAKSILAITDSRVDSDDWSLSAKMTKFIDDKKTALTSESMIQMNNIMGNRSLVIPDTNTSYNLLDSKDGNAGTWVTTGQLILNANHQAKLMAGQRFGSTITWNLTSSQIDVHAA